MNLLRTLLRSRPGTRPVVFSYSADISACEKDQQWQQASAKNPKMMVEAFDKTLEVGRSMDPELVPQRLQPTQKLSREP